MSAAPDSHVSGSLSGALGYVTLNRPELQNAISHATWLRLPEIVGELRAGGARVIIFRAAGSAFSAGADLNDLESIVDETTARKQWFAIRDALDFIFHFPLPTIAMVHGACLGGGCLLSIACDMRFAATPAWFSIPVSKLGIILDDGNVARLVSLVGNAVAREMLFTARTVSSAEAEKIGLVNKTVAPDELPHLVEQTAESIIANAPQALVFAKRSINRVMDGSFDWRQDAGTAGSAGDGADTGCEKDKDVIASYLSPEFQERIKKR